MATQGQLTNLSAIAEALRKIDKDKLLRPTLGEASIKETFSDRLEQINRKLEFATEFAPAVHDEYVSQVVSAFQNIHVAMQNQASLDNAHYVASRDQFLININSYLEQLQRSWPAFVTAAVEARGFLQDEGIRKEYQRTIDAMKVEAENSLKLVKAEAEKTIEEARKLAKQIEDGARRTAAHISVEVAQREFKEAGNKLWYQVMLWSGFIIVSLVCFGWFALDLLEIEPGGEWTWRNFYHSGLRITLLGGVGAVAAFCFRMFRAHLHMYQHNLHRQRLTNSMATLVESAVTPEQRDLILGHLVGSIAAFGSSGILQKEDDSIHYPKMIIDTIQRTVAPPSSK